VPLPKNCAACTMFTKEEECHRHAPSPSTERLERTGWNKREPDSVCAEGEVERRPIRCADCFFWWSPLGGPVVPKPADPPTVHIWGIPRDPWWDDAKLCVHHTVPPGSIGKTEVFHARVTHATDGCGVGKLREEVAKKSQS
jgi:hypothetical protein